jgi:N6-adenosine-specific RNA methylase IME4
MVLPIRKDQAMSLETATKSGVVFMPISAIQVSDKHRDIDQEAVSKIAMSTVREMPDETYMLVAGRHRLEALREIGESSVPANLVDWDEDTARMWEISENLHRADLSSSERSIQTAEYIALHQKRADAVNGPSVNPVACDRVSKSEGGRGKTGGITEAAEKLGIDPGTARKAIRISEIPADIIDRVKRLFLDNERNLLELAKLNGDHAAQSAKVEELHKLQIEKSQARLKKKEEKEAEDNTKETEKGLKFDSFKEAQAWAREQVEQEKQQRIEEKKAKRVETEQKLAIKQQALPDKRYGVIVADPEWKFETWSENGMDRSAENHYPTSDLEEIKARDVASIAADDCVLFLWATVPMLPQALEVMATWGFSYKSHLVWDKDKIGNGYWFRNRHELLLVGTKGSVPAPAPGMQWVSVLNEKATAHSAKPESSLNMIETYFPNLPKIELNRRGPARPGWDAWGNETEDSNSSDAEPADPDPDPVTFAIEFVTEQLETGKPKRNKRDTTPEHKARERERVRAYREKQKAQAQQPTEA